MLFSAPIWLLALAPWAAVSLYLLWGRRKRVDVSFLDFWKGPVEGIPVRRKIAPPPLALLLAMASMLFAIVAAAGPGVRSSRAGGAEPLFVIIDRGVTMSARAGQRPRFVEEAQALSRSLSESAGPALPVEVLLVPPPVDGPAARRMTVAELGGIAPAATAVDTTDMVRAAARARLAQQGGPLVVVSDADLGIQDERLVQVAPASRPANVAIVALAARATPRSQVMVRIRNDGSPPRSATLRVSSAGQTVERTAELPAAGASGEWFIDMRQLGTDVAAELLVDDALAADNRAWLAREADWPVIEPATPVGQLERLLDLYRTTRPPGDRSTRVRIVAAADQLAREAPGVILAGRNAGGRPVRPARVAAHPVTDAVRDWTSLEIPAPVDGASPPAGWTPLLWDADERVLLAVREVAGATETPVRQAWVALATDGWSQRPQYVVFWAALFDWVGRGGDAFVAHELPATPEPDWRPPTPVADAVGIDPARWPGLFTREDGATRAYRAATPDTSTRVVGSGDAWRQKLATLLARAGVGRVDLSPAFALAAAACLAGAALTWRRRPARSVAVVPRPARARETAPA